MQVLLQEQIVNLGNIGDQVKVSPGYARNYLLPTGKAVRVTAENLAHFESIRAELEKKHAEVVKQAEARAKEISKLTLSLKSNSSPEGKLYGSVVVADIVELITAAGVEIAKSEVHLTSGPIRHVGEFEVLVQLPGDVILTQSVKVDAMDGQLDETAQAAAEELLEATEEAAPEEAVEVDEADDEADDAAESISDDASADSQQAADAADADENTDSDNA